jgi:hypothetical protein
MWHDRGLALVYGAALGGWSFVVLRSLFAGSGRTNDAVAVVLAIVVAVLVIVEFHHIEDTRDKPRPVKDAAAGTAAAPRL